MIPGTSPSAGRPILLRGSTKTRYVTKPSKIRDVPRCYGAPQCSVPNEKIEMSLRLPLVAESLRSGHSQKFAGYL